MSDRTPQLREVYEWNDLDKFHWHTFNRRSYIVNGQVNEALLQEGLAMGLAKDAIQWAVGAAGEYGLGAVTMPAGGAGLAIGPTVETVIDSLFAVESVASSVDAALSFAQNMGGELGDVFMDMWSSVEGLIQGGMDSLGGLYNNIVTIVRSALKLIGDGGEKSMQKATDKVRSVIEKLINKLIDSIVQGIKVVLPDATASASVSAALRTALTALATNAYTVASGVIESIGPLKEFLTNPDVAVEFFKGVLDQVVELMIAIGEKIEDTSWLATVAAAAVTAPVGGLALPAIKALGPDGFNAIADQLKEYIPVILKVIDSVLTVLMPAMFAALAIYQIIASEDWKTEKEDTSESSKRFSTLASLLFEAEGEEQSKAEIEVTGDAGKDLETAFNAGPEGVRAFMDSNKNPDVIEILTKASEEYDGSDPDDKIKISGATPTSVAGLGPTQQFIDLMQSVTFPLGGAKELNAAVTMARDAGPIAISGAVVLDGHHRWSGTYAITPEGSISAKDFQFPGSVRDKLAAAQLAVAAINKGGKHPSMGGAASTDIIGKGKDEIFAMIDANKGLQEDDNAPGALLNDNMIQDIADGNYPEILNWAGLTGEEEFVSLKDSDGNFENDPIRKAIAEKVATNLSNLPQPVEGAPESRADMPQLDHPLIGGKNGLASIEAGLPAGEFNVHPPFKKESISYQNDLIIERWQKLAGIIKG